MCVCIFCALCSLFLHLVSYAETVSNYMHRLREHSDHDLEWQCFPVTVPQISSVTWSQHLESIKQLCCFADYRRTTTWLLCTCSVMSVTLNYCCNKSLRSYSVLKERMETQTAQLSEEERTIASTRGWKAVAASCKELAKRRFCWIGGSFWVPILKQTS